MADVKKTVASITLAAALAGGIYETTIEEKVVDPILPNEKIELRTDISSTVDLGKNSRATQIFTRPIHYKDADSVYKTIQTDVYKRPLLIALLSKYEYKTDAGLYKAYYDAEKPWNYYAESPDGKRWIEFEALFNESEDLTIKVETRWNGVKETITLRSEKAPTELRWIVKANGITPNTPTAHDLKLKPVMVSEKTAGDTLIYTIDTKDAVYPIVIDPSANFVDTDDVTGNIYVASDSLRSARDSTAATFANATAVGSGMFLFDGAWYISRGLFRYDTSALPDGATIDTVRVMIVLSDTTYYRSTPGCYLKMIEADDTLSVAHFNTSMYTRFKGWVSGINQKYTPIILTDSLTVVQGAAYGDTLKFLGLTALKNEINLAGTTQMFLVMGADMGAGPYNYTVSLMPQFGDDSPYLLIYYHTGVKYGGATLSTVGGAVLSKLGGAP